MARPMKWADFPDVMGVADASRALGVSGACVRGMFRAGVIPAVKVGQRWLAAKENVQRFVSEGGSHGAGKSDAA